MGSFAPVLHLECAAAPAATAAIPQTIAWQAVSLLMEAVRRRLGIPSRQWENVVQAMAIRLAPEASSGPAVATVVTAEARVTTVRLAIAIRCLALATHLPR